MREHHVNSEGVGLENAERGVTTPGLAHEAAHAEKVRSDELYRQQLEEARRRDPAQPPPPQLRKSRRHLSMSVTTRVLACSIGTDPSHLSHVSRTPVQVNIERKPGDEPPITPWESRTSACVEAAKLVQLYCVGAAEDKGMAEAAPFLEALHCTNVLRG
eukprot:2965657-Pyramimonas_sp.AAC.1